MAIINEFLLIEAVHECPILWDPTHDLYATMQPTQWLILAERLGHTVDACKTTWEKLLERYTAMKLQIPGVPESGPRSWAKEELMKFLDKTIVPQRGLSNAFNVTVTTVPPIPSIPLIPTTHQTLSNVKQKLIRNDELVDREGKADNAEDSVTASIVSTSTLMRAQTLSNVKRMCIGNDELIDSQDKTDNAEDCLSAIFVKYFALQVKDLLQGKAPTQQRMIRKRLSTCVEWLFEDFQ